MFNDVILPVIRSGFLLTFPALTIVGGLKDATSYTIPNWISLALVALYLPAALAMGVPLAGIGLSMGVGLVALVAGMIMFAMGWIGGGDAKLFAAAGLWLGWPAFLPFVTITALCGGGLAVVLLEARSMTFRPYFVAAPSWLGRLATPGGDVPYGVAICVGALAAFPGSLLATSFSGF